jgi:hypothetical protein
MVGEAWIVALRALDELHGLEMVVAAAISPVLA